MDPTDDPHSAAYFNDQRDFWFNGDWLRLLARRLGFDQVRRALDVGSGQGYWTLLLAPLLAPDAKLVGVEREPEWVQHAGERARERGLGDRGQEREFDGLWERRLAEGRRTRQALREGRSDSAGGHIHYLISGRRPG